jgi:hypothetical protein
MPRILFRYMCGVQANTKFSPHMLTNCSTKLMVDNFLSPFIQSFEENVDSIDVIVE